MKNFLWWIGSYNAFGSLVLMAMHHNRIADFMLRKVTEVVAKPYSHSPGNRIWLWWAATVNLFLGVIMVRAAYWPVAIQREVTIATVAVYAVMYVVLVIGGRGPYFARGVYALHVLWIAQMAWGVWAFLSVI